MGAFVRDCPVFGFQHYLNADSVHPVQSGLISKRSTGDAIASLLALQTPAALLVEENGVLVERDVDANLLLACNTFSLVLSTMSKLDPNNDQILGLDAFDK